MIVEPYIMVMYIDYITENIKEKDTFSQKKRVLKRATSAQTKLDVIKKCKCFYYMILKML